MGSAVAAAAATAGVTAVGGGLREMRFKPRQ